MINSPVVEVVIGLILIYLVLGLVCTSVNEYIAQLLGLRAENLVEAIYGLFTGPDRHLIAEDIYDEPIVRSLCRKQFGLDLLNGPRLGEIDKLPSAIPPSVFSSALINVLRKNDLQNGGTKYSPETLSVLKPMLDAADKSLASEKVKPAEGAAVPQAPAPETASQVPAPHAAATEAVEPKVATPPVEGAPAGVAAAPATTAVGGDTYDRAKPAIEEWYGQALKRAGGWYKRRTQVMSLMVALGLVFAVNADTISIYKRLSNSPVDRAKLDAFANSAKRSTASPSSAETGDEGPEITVSDAAQSGSMDFLGWASPNSADPRKMPTDFYGWLAKLVGLAITAFAVSLGAPFWFDVLSKFMTVRSGGDPSPKPGDKPAAKAPAAQGAM